MNYFFAVSISEDIRQKLTALAANWQKTLSGCLDVQWHLPEDYHITLKFMGELAEAEHMAAVARAVARSQSPFQIDISGYGAFPSLVKPQVLFAKVGAERDPRLVHIAARLDQSLKAFGLPQEKRPYLPHITLGRCRAITQSDEAIPGPDMNELMFGRLLITQIVLVQSAPPEMRKNRPGLRYNIVQAFPFL